MVDRISHTPSRIPIPVKSPPPRSFNGKLSSRSPVNIRKTKDETSFHAENGQCVVDKIQSPQKIVDQKKDMKGFETFVMTGEMIIQTTPKYPKSPKLSAKTNPLSQQSICSERTSSSSLSSQDSHTYKPPDPSQDTVNTEPDALSNEVLGEQKINSSPPSPDHTNHHVQSPSNDVPKSSVIALERSIDSAQTASVDSDMIISDIIAQEITSTDSSLTSDELGLRSQGDSGATDSSPVDGGNESQNLFDTEESSESSNFDSNSAPLQNGQDSHTDLNKNEVEVHKNIATSKSVEKISSLMSKSDHPLVRTSKSHENCLQAGAEFALVTIDLDDNMANSLDTLSYDVNTVSKESADKADVQGASRSLNSSPDRKLEKSDVQETSRSLNNSPDRKIDSSDDRVFMPSFINLEEPRLLKVKPKDVNKTESGFESYQSEDAGKHGFRHEVNEMVFTASEANELHAGNVSLRDSTNSGNRGLLRLEDFGDFDSVYHQPSKQVDRPSAARLAKRLFLLEGFRKSDVSRHLSRKNDFNNLVAEEYLKYFDFSKETLDVSLRKFLKQFSLTGETQERERVLIHFSKWYMDCNPGAFNSEDACHTLTCAIMLLNTDLHGQTARSKMSCTEFIENLAELNEGENFSKDTLKAIYNAIKNEKIEWSPDEDFQDLQNHNDDRSAGPAPNIPTNIVGQNPFLAVPDPSKTTEYKRSFVMRKCCKDHDGRRTSFGKRGWKMFYIILRDMILYHYKDENHVRKGQIVEGTSNAVRIHHSLATKAIDYTKKQHVMRLHTADWGEYLFQTSDSKELQEWIDTINFAAACLSAPSLPGAVGSKAKFQRPLLPSSCTRLNMADQFRQHEQRLQELEKDLHDHRANPPEKGSKSRVIQDYIEKELYLEYEIKRYKTYVYLLQSKMVIMSSYEPSLVETAIGEDEESVGFGPRHPKVFVGQKVQRSISDRPDDMQTTTEKIPVQFREEQTRSEASQGFAVITREEKQKIDADVGEAKNTEYSQLEIISTRL